jgi:RimJ/RimL family protein N-acetyltransferase
MEPFAISARGTSARPSHRAVRIRTIRPSDAPALRRFYEGLSPESRRLRFFSINACLSDAVSTSFCTTDHDHREGFVAVAASASGRDAIVGHLCLEPDARSGSTAEVAIAVADAYQGRGIGRRLLRAGLAWARREGISRLTATMLPGNAGIHRLLLGCGFPAATSFVDGGVAEVAIDLVPATIAA